MDSYPVSLLESPQAVSGRPLSARTSPASCFHNRNCERPVENLPGFEEHFRLYPLTDQLRCWLTLVQCQGRSKTRPLGRQERLLPSYRVYTAAKVVHRATPCPSLSICYDGALMPTNHIIAL